MEIRPVGPSCSMRTDGQTDKHYTANGCFSHFRNFANAPKIGTGGGGQAYR